jgi:uncharacterized protein with GYD domain
MHFVRLAFKLAVNQVRERSTPIPMYLGLVKRTDQGVKTPKDAVSRFEQGRLLIEQAGGRVVGLWWTQGFCDAVPVTEWPDDESANVFSLSHAMAGSVRTETLRAFTTEEMQRVRVGDRHQARPPDVGKIETRALGHVGSHLYVRPSEGLPRAVRRQDGHGDQSAGVAVRCNLPG